MGGGGLFLVFVNVSGTQESILPACVAWRAGTNTRVVVPACQAGNRFLVIPGLPKRYTNTGSGDLGWQ